MRSIAFFDLEVNPESGKILDYGAVDAAGNPLHTQSPAVFAEYIKGKGYLCGHNIIAHDLQYLQSTISVGETVHCIDTLCLSPLLFPSRPYHKLLKDDKLQTDELNNPLNDAVKARDLFHDEVNAYLALSPDLQKVYCSLLADQKEFSGFFHYMGAHPTGETALLIQKVFEGEICANCRLSAMIANHPIALAYCLALITAEDEHSITPKWVHYQYPVVETFMRLLRNTPCGNCSYCSRELNIHHWLKRSFGYDSFRTYDGEPLQENAARAAVHGEALLAIFPTGGGKSITFQLPALIDGAQTHALTVVISPLQSLMKDQVDNLEEKGIYEAVTINGLLSPIERAEAIERVQNGMASILYISPESLRSKVIERLLLSRTISRFVIDEAHCFSAWGQDFRVDYLYIGDFIRELESKKRLQHRIPVSCFTATAKQKVISDIKEYFKEKLALDLTLYATNAARTNLRYEVIYRENDEEKYTALRDLISLKNCPTIVYVSRTKRTKMLAERLSNDGISARPYNGKMDSQEKSENQEMFIRDEIQVIVATSAFGMGVDKSNVKLVVHYDISDSLENYVQEAGRAGRNESLQAECYVLYNDSDLDKHFILLNQTKLSMSEIQQIWRAVKELTRIRPTVCCSALELARQAGWDDSNSEMETRVRTAISALEQAGYVKRGKNCPRVFADSIQVRTMAEASERIEASDLFTDAERTNAKRIIQRLISDRSVKKAQGDDPESRVDYISDILGIEKEAVIHSIHQMRQMELLADAEDLTAYLPVNEKTAKMALNRFVRLETFMLDMLHDEGEWINLKEWNSIALERDMKFATVKAMKTIAYFWMIKGYAKIVSDGSGGKLYIEPKTECAQMILKCRRRQESAAYVLNELYERSIEQNAEKNEILVLFSVLSIMRSYQMGLTARDVTMEDVEEALLYLAKIQAIKLEGGFMVLYSGMELKRLELDNKIQYKKDDYRQLDAFYQQKIQQIHIVGEYANMMVRDYDAALQFVSDYFCMEYQGFLRKYFAGTRKAEIERNITPKKYMELFDSLSPAQRTIIDDNSSQYIVVVAGPGSGKTKVLVHKLASLLLLEDVKHEQLLMVTFSRAAAIEFKQRLRDLIGNAASFVEIKTFHSYCFDLLGKIGTLDESQDVVEQAVTLLQNGEVEQGRIAKTVLVIDEAQDMDAHEFALIEALMAQNETMRVIAVGDDDQNIYGFRGANAEYMRSFITKHNAVQYDLLQNYRSKQNIVVLANAFVQQISDRMKREPIEAVQQACGTVQIVQHRSANLEEPVVRHLLANADRGSVAVLTSTNDEALSVMGLLLQHGQKAKLIQTLDGFRLSDLAELRHFLRKSKPPAGNAVISDALWNQAKESMQIHYGSSTTLPICLDVLAAFENANERKYRSDFKQFLLESKMEDFFRAESGTVMVSTMHKAKGREFDHVYILLAEQPTTTDEERRKLYVGMTRAKETLYIHDNSHVFDALSVTGVRKETDTNRYEKPGSLVLQMSHRDVFLGFFMDKQESLLSIRSGTELKVHNWRLYANGNPVAQFSKDFHAKLERLAAKGYRVVKATVRFVLAWKNQGDGKEYAILLPDIYLERSGS